MTKTKIDIEGNHNTSNTAARDVINVNFPKSEPDAQLLVSAQRKQLNNTVQKLAKSYGNYIDIDNIKTLIRYSEDDTNEIMIIKYIWHLLHVHLGVETIGQIKCLQFQKASDYLEYLAVSYKNEYFKKPKLIHVILKKSTDNNIKKHIISWCNTEFGESMLTKLSHEQLLKVQIFLNQKIDEVTKPKGLLELIKSTFQRFI